MQQFQTYQSRLDGAPRTPGRLASLVMAVVIGFGLIQIIRMAAALSVDLAGVVTQAQAIGGM